MRHWISTVESTNVENLIESNVTTITTTATATSTSSSSEPILPQIKHINRIVSSKNIRKYKGKIFLQQQFVKFALSKLPLILMEWSFLCEFILLKLQSDLILLKKLQRHKIELYKFGRMTTTTTATHHIYQKNIIDLNRNRYHELNKISNDIRLYLIMHSYFVCYCWLLFLLLLIYFLLISWFAFVFISFQSIVKNYFYNLAFYLNLYCLILKKSPSQSHHVDKWRIPMNVKQLILSKKKNESPLTQFSEFKKAFSKKKPFNFHFLENYLMKSFNKSNYDRQLSIYQLVKMNSLNCVVVPVKPIIVVRMVQIVVANDKNATSANSSSLHANAWPSSNNVSEAPSLQDTNLRNEATTKAETQTKNVSENRSTATGIESTSYATVNQPTTVTINSSESIKHNVNNGVSSHINVFTKAATLNKTNVDASPIILLQTNEMSTQANAKLKVSQPTVASGKANTSSATSKKSNVIMVKKSKLKDNANGKFATSRFSTFKSATKSKFTENRSSTETSVIIMNKSCKIKNGSNLITTQQHQTKKLVTQSDIVTTQSNHLIRILNSPTKSKIMNIDQTYTLGGDNTTVTKSQIICNLPNTVKSAEKTITLASSQVVNELNTNNLTNNLFICKTDGKLIRLTPLMGSNCYNNAATTNTVQVTSPVATNKTVATKLLQDDEQNFLPIFNEKRIEKSDIILSNSPPPLTPTINLNTFMINKASFAIAAPTNSNKTEQNAQTKHTIFEENCTKFIHTEDMQKEMNFTLNASDGNISSVIGGNLVFGEVIDANAFDEAKLSTKTNVFTTARGANVTQTQSTLLQCHGAFLKTGSTTQNLNSPNTKHAIKSGSLPANASIYLKPIIKHSQLQATSTGIRESSFKNNGDLKKNSKKEGKSPEHKIVLHTGATKTATPLNQVHITFPFTNPSNRNISVPTLNTTAQQLKTNCARSQQVLITKSNVVVANAKNDKEKDAATIVHKIQQPEQRNLVDQLREFDMVMEQIKERSINTTSTTLTTTTSSPSSLTLLSTVNTDKLTPTNLNGFNRQLAIIDNRQNSTSSTQKPTNVAIIQKKLNKPSSLSNTLLSEISDSTTTQSIILVNDAKALTSKNQALSISTISLATADNSSKLIATIPVSNENQQISTTNQSLSQPNSKSTTQNSQQQQQLQQSGGQQSSSKQPHKSQEDEQTVQRIYDILAQYAEQISSSPDLNNKPAPRRRSNLVSFQSSTGSSSTAITTTVSNCLKTVATKTTATPTTISFNLSTSTESSQSAIIMTRKRKRSTSSLPNDDSESLDTNSGSSEAVNNIFKSNANNIITDSKKRRLTNVKKLNDSCETILVSTPSLATLSTNVSQSQIIFTTAGNNKNINALSLIPNNSALIQTKSDKSIDKSKESNSSAIHQNMLITNGSSKNLPLTIGISQCTTTPASLSSSMDHHRVLLRSASAHQPNIKHEILDQTNTMPTILIPGNYLLPMGIFKYSKQQKEHEQQEHQLQQHQTNRTQMFRSNMTTVVIPTTTTTIQQKDKMFAVGNASDSNTSLKTQNIKFNISQPLENCSKPSQSSSSSSSALLLRTLPSGSSVKSGNKTHTNATNNDGKKLFSENVMSTFTKVRQHQQQQQHLQTDTSSIPTKAFPSKIFQSNRGIIILDNKYAALLTTNYTVPTTTTPIVTERKCFGTDMKLVNTINASDVVVNANSCEQKPIKNTLDTPLNVMVDTNSQSDIKYLKHESFLQLDSPKSASKIVNDKHEYFFVDDTINEHDTIATLATNNHCDMETSVSTMLPIAVFGHESNDKIFDGMLTEKESKSLPSLVNDCNDVDATNMDVPELMADQLFRNVKASENVVIIDKQKSDTLTLNAVSSSTRRNIVAHTRANSQIERELQLQKSLSEECEDLGVDEPITSELFPEADLSFDTDSPVAFDLLNQHHRTLFEFPSRLSTVKSSKVSSIKYAGAGNRNDDIKANSKINFSDDQLSPTTVFNNNIGIGDSSC